MYSEHNYNYLKEIIQNEIISKIVVQVWTGYGKVLFFGIGDKVIPDIKENELHPNPPYELQTDFSSWSIKNESGFIYSSEDEHLDPSLAIKQFIGRQITFCQIAEDNLSLEIHCSNLILKIIPFSDEEFINKDAWSICLPDESYISVRCNLSIYTTKT